MRVYFKGTYRGFQFKLSVRDMDGAFPDVSQIIPNGDTLITSSRTSEVMQYDIRGDKVWSAGDLPLAYDAVRLSSGNTLVAYRKGLREIDREGGVVREVPLGNARRISIY